MTISDVLEHWATIYKPLSHRPDTGRLEDQSFFRIRYIDLENIFQRNANIIHSPCMLQSVTSTGELKGAKSVKVSHQIWLLSKIKDSAQTLGRYDGKRLEQSSNDLVEYAEDLVAWLVEVKRTGICPITKRSFRDEPQVLSELSNIDLESISYGVIPDIYSGQWLIVGVNWDAVKPLYKFGCGSNGKYITANTTIE